MSWRLLVWHTVLIVLHATAATVALMAGAWAMPSGRFFGVYRGPTGVYLEHLGFTLIALTVGFVIIAVLRTGGPLAVGVVAGAVVILVGRRMVRTAKERLVGVRPRSEPDARVRR